ncbi:hypothetical protein B0H16DRAFT_312852 [Mycena metata]|uniref:Uncharacterized protein n=1 Tax=Mycena metata TaxID=1033252 RepID=A0AAD7NMZ8_9AGAR|nr:hypothetical protein B0H16DRAFT_312852 [Mycena metata]
MGTRGYRVYRWKGYYHVQYNHYDSYPDGLGVQIASEIPVRDEESYKQWLQAMRDSLDEDLENNKDLIDEIGDGRYFITTNQPTTDIFIEWVYEIDLDHEVFLVDSSPLFALKNTPSMNLFVECIGVDSYGHRSYKPSTPKEHIYHWKSDPPQVEQSVIDDYATRQANSSDQLSISELLGTTDSISDCESVRIAIHEVIIGLILGEWRLGNLIRHLETAPDRTQIPEAGVLLPIGVDMVQVVIGRMLFGATPKRAPVEARSGSGFGWLAPDICLRITTHLDDARNAKKAILELVDEIIAHRQPGRVTYGIIFSCFHCIIVRVDTQNSFMSTSALQFLPSFYATSSSTPGTTAIGRLGLHCLNTNRESVANSVNTGHFLHNVPAEVLEEITVYLGPSALGNLCAAVPLFKPAAGRVLRFPHVDDYRLVGLFQDEEIKRSLTAKGFSATQNGVPELNMVIGVGGSGAFGVSIGVTTRDLRWDLQTSAEV